MANTAGTLSLLQSAPAGKELLQIFKIDFLAVQVQHRVFRASPQFSV